MFKYVGALGSGSNETEVTHEINKLTGQHVAIKQIPKYRFTFDDPEAGLPNFMREVTALHRLRKACTEKKTYVLCGLGFYEDDEYWYLVTEFSPDLMPMTRLDTEAWDLSPQIRAKIIINLVKGLKRIHASHVAHNDIAERNILFDPYNGDIRYIDFGQACYEGECRNNDAIELREIVFKRLIFEDEYNKASRNPKHPLFKALKLLSAH